MPRFVQSLLPSATRPAIPRDEAPPGILPAGGTGLASRPAPRSGKPDLNFGGKAWRAEPARCTRRSPKHTAVLSQSPPPSSRWGDVFRCPGRKPCVLPARPRAPRAAEGGRSGPPVPKEPVSSGGRADAGPKAWACGEGGSWPG